VNLLDRYIFKSALFICCATMGLFAFLLMLGNVARDLLGPFLAGQLSAPETGRLVLLTFPFVVSYALPMGVLTGVLLTLGRLSADNEVTAIRSAGISVVRMARPIVVLGVIGALAGLRINFESMPWAKTQYENEFTSAVRANPLSFLVPRTFIRDFPGFVVYVGEKKGTGFKDFWLWELDRDRRVIRLVRAAQGSFDYAPATNELILTLYQAGIETRNERNPEDFSTSQPVGTFEKWEEVRLPLDKIFNKGGMRQKLRWMTYGELRAKESALAREKPRPGQEAEQARARMDVAFTIQEKFNTAFAVLSFALVGVPLGVKMSRRETSANLGMAVLLALGYYFLTTAISWLDQHPSARPDLLLWLPNLAFIGIAGWLFRRIDLKGR
jgi:lipopolysaccharide export system permease protein